MITVYWKMIMNIQLGYKPLFKKFEKQTYRLSKIRYKKKNIQI
jgi:hypothetical protein